MNTLIIGAGTAGLAAARDLSQMGESVIVLEARNRIGGRVHTDHTFAGVPTEFGAELIHGDFAPTWLLVREFGLRTTHWTKTDDSLVHLADGSLRTMAEARRLYPDFDLTRSWALPTPPDATEDVSFEDYLRHIGFSDNQVYYTRRSWGNAACEDISRISAQASYEDITDESAGSGDFRILEGYNRIHEGLATGIDIRLDSVVASIAWDQQPMQVTLTDGTVYEAHRVIVTLPLGVLQAERVQFIPALPDWKREAIQKLIMGPAIKMIYRFDTPVLPEGIAALYSAQNPPMWWSSTAGRQDTHAHTMTAFVTGDWARELLALGEAEALQAGLRTLQAELGREIPAPVDACLVNWVTDPYALGGYSVVPVGGRALRATLAQPIADRLFWAGEATAFNPWAATVHGAYASGRRAAAEVGASISNSKSSDGHS